VSRAKIRPGQLAQEGAATNQVLAWNGTAWAPATASAGTPQFWDDVLTGSGGENGVTLGQTPLSRSERLWLFNVPLDRGVDYTISGANVTLASNLSSGDKVRVYYAYAAGLTGAAATLTGFTPAGLSGLSLWLDASQLTGIADGGAVASWTDFSGSSRHAVQATGTKQPIYRSSGALITPGGKPALQFDGVDDSVASTWSNAGDQTQFIVAASTSTSGLRSLFGAAGNRGGLEMRWNNGTSLSNEVDNYASIGSYTITQPTTYQQLTSDYTYASGNMTAHVWLNGTQVISVTTTGDTSKQITPAAGRLLAAQGSPAISFLQGGIAEFIEYNRLLTSTERTAVQNYLKSRHGTP